MSPSSWRNRSRGVPPGRPRLGLQPRESSEPVVSPQIGRYQREDVAIEPWERNWVKPRTHPQSLSKSSETRRRGTISGGLPSGHPPQAPRVSTSRQRAIRRRLIAAGSPLTLHARWSYSVASSAHSFLLRSSLCHSSGSTPPRSPTRLRQSLQYYSPRSVRLQGRASHAVA